MQQLGQGDQAGLPGLGCVVDHDAVEAAGGFVVAQAAPAGQGVLHGLRGQGLGEVAGFDDRQGRILVKWDQPVEHVEPLAAKFLEVVS